MHSSISSFILTYLWLQAGLAHIFIQHTSASLTINENAGGQLAAALHHLFVWLRFKQACTAPTAGCITAACDPPPPARNLLRTSRQAALLPCSCRPRCAHRYGDVSEQGRCCSSTEAQQAAAVAAAPSPITLPFRGRRVLPFPSKPALSSFQAYLCPSNSNCSFKSKCVQVVPEGRSAPWIHTDEGEQWLVPFLAYAVSRFWVCYLIDALCRLPHHATFPLRWAHCVTACACAPSLHLPRFVAHCLVIVGCTTARAPWSAAGPPAPQAPTTCPRTARAACLAAA